MRITLLSAAFLLFLQTCFAAVPVSPLSPQPAESAAKPPAVHGKGKGTVGLISGLLLGPVGLGGVYLFTHNHAQRKAAKKGCVIFATVVVTVALCAFIVVLAGKSGGSPSLGSSSRSGGSGGSSGSGRSGGSGSSGGGARPSGGGRSSNSSQWSNLNFPNIGPSPSGPKKKPAQGPLPADLPYAMTPLF
jgi:hypothetical protein